MVRKYVLATLAALLVFFFFSYSGAREKTASKTLRIATLQNADSLRKVHSENRAIDSARHLKNWLKKNGYSTNLVFLVDMNLSMYLKRFYVINPDSQKVLHRFLVAHGSGLGSTSDSVVFSNVSGSNCTSRGKYKLGNTLFGEYGKGYWMDGLESCNCNARKRWIVFHYYTPQTTEEFHEHNFFSLGCPMLAESSFKFCDSLIQREKRPVLMYIYK